MKSKLPSSSLVRRSVVSHVAMGLAVACALFSGACKKKDGGAGGDSPGEGGEAKPKEEPLITFKAKWPVGQRLVQRTDAITESGTQNPTTQQVIKQEMTMQQEIAFTVLKEREGGGFEVDAEYLLHRTTNRMNSAVASSFDSRGDTKGDRNNPVAPTLRKLVGSKVKFHMAADGKVEKVDGVPQLLQKLNAGATPQAQILVRGMVNEDAVKSWSTFHTGLPDGPVKVGDSWQVLRDIPFGMGMMSQDFTNTFKGWEERGGKKLAVLENAGTMTSKPVAGSQLTLSVGEGAATSGKAWFDPELGMIIESQSVAAFDLTINTASGQSITSKTKVNSTSKLLQAQDTGPAPAATVTIPTKTAPAKAAVE